MNNAKKFINQNIAVVIIATLVSIIILAVGAIALVRINPSKSGNVDTNNMDQLATESGASDQLLSSGLTLDFSKSSIELVDVLSGGPGKDGIPAINSPKFEPVGDSDVDVDTQVMLVENNGETKMYPYSILVWHEIVNDIVGGKPLAITFCPLCGSAIVFEREIDNKVIEFGVSGFLYESNLLMYSREESESLWSQSRGEAVVGRRTGTKLEHFPLQLLTFGDAKQRFPGAVVLSDDTGYNRNYTGNPYAGYSEKEETIFPVSVTDKKFPAKEVFYIVPLEGMSIAVRQDKSDGIYDVPDSDIKVTFDKGKITAMWGDAEIPGYFEMWFSWATHNQQTGIVL